jgi:DNA-binding NarL/FixJ family response regulator
MNERAPAAYRLTYRQRVALHALAIGFTQRQAGAHFGADERTVRRVVREARQAMGAATHTQAVALAVRAGLVDPARSVLGAWDVRP